MGKKGEKKKPLNRKRSGMQDREKTGMVDGRREVELSFDPSAPSSLSSAGADRRGSSEAKAAQTPAFGVPPEDLVKAGVTDARDAGKKGGDSGVSPLFKKLDEPALPSLSNENRARLQMQSPSRLYFYWSLKKNPYKALRRVFGDDIGTYTLVAKFIDENTGAEEVFAVEPEGNWWFDARPDTIYRAEIGFYAPNRPYFRIIFSNELRTPRRGPSKRRDYIPSFNVTAHQFAEVLNVSGYSRDAFEVAVAGDDPAAADDATLEAYSQMMGTRFDGAAGADPDELRYVLLALASGFKIEDLRSEIGEGLYDVLSASRGSLTSKSAMAALSEYFDIFEGELIGIEEQGPAVHGASGVHLPKRTRTRAVPKTLLRSLSRFDTVSSSR